MPSLIQNCTNHLACSSASDGTKKLPGCLSFTNVSSAIVTNPMPANTIFLATCKIVKVQNYYTTIHFNSCKDVASSLHEKQLHACVLILTCVVTVQHSTEYPVQCDPSTINTGNIWQDPTGLVLASIPQLQILQCPLLIPLPLAA